MTSPPKLSLSQAPKVDVFVVVMMMMMMIIIIIIIIVSLISQSKCIKLNSVLTKMERGEIEKIVISEAE